jgi:hypothetical protein
MANFTINFTISNEGDARPTPIYRVGIVTGTVGTPLYANTSFDQDILLIERKSTTDGYVDEFYGIVKAGDFAAFQRGGPAEGQVLYRAHAWTLVFYNLETMQESLALMRAQVKDLAEDVRILSKFEAQRTETYISPAF